MILTLSFPLLAKTIISRKACGEFLNNPTIKDRRLALKHKNEYESQKSKIYRGNIKNLGLEVKTQQKKLSGIHDSFVPDMQLAFLNDPFHLFKGGGELKKLLYEAKGLTRDQIKEWTQKYIPDTQAIFIDEITDLAKKPILKGWSESDIQSNIYSNGSIENQLYFSLVKNKYIPIGDDHDLIAHLLLYANPRTRELTFELAQKLSSPKSYSSAELESLEFAWQVLQETRVIIDTEGRVHCIGGYYSLFMDGITLGRPYIYSPFQFIEKMFNTDVHVLFKSSEKFNETLTKLKFRSLKNFLEQARTFNESFSKLRVQKFVPKISQLTPRAALESYMKDVEVFLTNNSFFLKMNEGNNFDDFFQAYLDSL